MVSRTATIVAAVLLLAGCYGKTAAPGAATAAPQGLLQEIQSVLVKIVGSAPVQLVVSDLQATITQINTDLASGKITALTASQQLQCPTNALQLIQGIQAQVGAAIPPGAGISWLLYEVNGMSQQQLQGLTTQVKLIQGSCAALLKLPGLPVS